MSWLDTVLDEVSYVETPKNWLWWSALSAISAVTAPNITLNKGAYKLRPNLYVLLVGRSGLGKGFGISLAGKLVKMVGNTRIISGRGTIEGIIKDLAIVKAKENGSIPFKDARGFIISGEFAASMYDSMNSLTILTDLYDSHYVEEWTNTLKNSPIEKLRFPCITLLSGANQEMFDLAISKTHTTGGFIGRTLLINATNRDHANSLIDDVVDINYGKLVHHLEQLSKLNGEMKWTSEAKKVYNHWFYNYRKMEIEDKTGTFDRLNDHILKVATCISLARKIDMVLEGEDIGDAIVACSDLSNTARRTAGMQGKSPVALILKSFLMIMFTAENYEMSRKKVLQKGFGDFDSSELDKIIETLSQTGFIVQSQGGKEIKYKLTKACVEWWIRSTEKKS